MSPHALHRRAALLVTGACALLATVAPAVQASPVHQVAPGESLWQVAAANGLSPAALAAANGLSADAAVQAGQALTIPPQGAAPAAAAPAPPAGASGGGASSGGASSGVAGASGGGIVVQPGDTLTAIAARQGVTVTRLAALNGLSAASVLPAGARLALPAQGSGDGGGSASSTATATSSSGGGTGTTTTAASAPAPAGPAPGTAPASGARVTATDVGTVAAQNGVPASLARAIAWQESGFNNGAVSSVGARGVMQVMPGTWDWIGANLARTPLDPSSATDNVRAGTLYLGHLLRETGGDPDLAAAAYYQGLSSVRSRGMYDDTKRYVQSVRALRGRFGG
ncbi:LysM peptidoglycan-binding domain-containing protein [Patulibacter sp. SYSU D01012]|uniref:LysM peptidoglycan-binding domain-containing protein n=1 Tax=Patulibacter sp. SYSU D01012 TaxID=2817381 RepID=UPI001B310DBC